MKKIIFALSAVLFLAAVSCKKKETTPDSPPSTTGTSTAGGATFNGLFTTELIYSIYGTSTSTLNFGINSAFASTSSFDNFNFPLGVLSDMGTVTVNGTSFKNNFNYYMDTSYSYFAPPHVWSISGSAIPTFTYTNTDSYPTYTDYTMWPDTVHKSQGLSLPLTGITGATEAEIYLSVTGATTTANTATLVLGSPTSYSFNSSALSGLSTSTTASIEFDIYKNNIQTINGKKMNFRSVTAYIKTVQVKN